MTIGTSSAQALAQRLAAATNSHDLEALAGCFGPDFVNETPAHPARSFTGSDQVRKNWAQILATVPDLKADVIRQSIDGDVAWMEWEMRGTRADGSGHLMRGVTIFGLEDGHFSWARFYLEPVEEDGVGIDVAVREQLAR